MKHQHSFVAHAAHELYLPEHRLFLDRGRNVFTLFLEDLPRFRERLEQGGVTVLEVHDISQPATSLSDILLEGESPAV